MKAKATLKILVDIVMTALLLGQMGYHMMDNRMHEITGVMLCALFIAHHALNGGWHRGLLRGRYSAQRVLLTTIDALLMLVMLAIMTSAVLVSRHVFSFLGLHMRAMGRRIHMPATMWAFVLTGLHLGLHWNLVLQKARKHVRDGLPRSGPIVLRVAVIGLCCLGGFEFIRRGLWMQLAGVRLSRLRRNAAGLSGVLYRHPDPLGVAFPLSGKGRPGAGPLDKKEQGGKCRMKRSLCLILALLCAAIVLPATAQEAERGEENMKLIPGGSFLMGSPQDEPCAARTKRGTACRSAISILARTRSHRRNTNG